MSLFQQVPVNYLLTSGANSALTWTNAVSVSSMTVSSLGASNLSVSTLTTSTSVTSASLAASTLTVSSITANSVGYSTLSGSTINATRLNYSSIVGSSISTNAMTLSLTNASTQNTRIYQVATTNPTTSYTAIQASHVSTGTTNNALALNPSGGNVGVGTTAPYKALHVTGSSAGDVAALVANTNGGLASSASLGFGLWGTSGSGTGTTGYAAQISAVCANAANGNTDVTFNTYTGSVVAPNYTLVERMRISAAGNVGIGTTAPGYKLDVTGDVRIRGPTNGSGNSQALWIDNIDGGGLYSSYTRIRSVYEGSAGNILKLNTGHVATFVGGATVYFDGYTSNGTLSIINANGQIGVSSDRRIKENIVYQSDTQQGLASVLNLKPATFNMIGSSDSHLGFIAQDLEQEIPLAVDGKKYEWQWETTEDNKPKFDANGDIVYKLDADGNKIVRPRGVSDRAIIATQTLAIQELAKKLTAAEQQLDAKSAALDALIAWAQTMGYPASS